MHYLFNFQERSKTPENENIQTENDIKAIQDRLLSLNDLFKHATQNQSKEIEVKEENLLMDLYFNTLQNNHIFQQTEHKFEVK